MSDPGRAVPGPSPQLRPLVSLLIATGLCLAVGLAFAGTAAAAGNVTVTQEPGEAVAAPGTNVSLQVSLSVPGKYAPGADVDLPDGWEVIDQSTAPSGTYRADGNQWIWLQGGNKTIEYTVRVPPGAAGSYTVRVEGSAADPETDEIKNDTAETSIVVSTPTATATATETRSPTPGATPAPISTSTPTSSSSPSPSDTPTPSSSLPPSDTPTQSPSELRDVTSTPSHTDTPTLPGFGVGAALIAVLALFRYRLA
ncbi:MAG: hypothetical protein ABEH66_03010 [Halobacteriales archaeon]